MDHLSNRWILKSLTIGPQIHETSTQFWKEVFLGLPPLPGVINVTIICTYPTLRAFNVDCWKYFNRLIIREDLFPALESVDIQSSFASQQLGPQRWLDIYASLPAVGMRGLGPRKRISRAHIAARARVVGTRELLAFKQGHRTDSPCKI